MLNELVTPGVLQAAEADEDQYCGEGRCNTLPEHRQRSALPNPHEAGYCVRHGLRQPLHGGSPRGSLGRGEVAVALRQGDGGSGDRLPQDRWKWVVAHYVQ